MLAYLVARRTSEIGVRRALGAARSHVVFIVFRESIAPVAIGLAGSAATIVATRWVQSLFFGVSASDPSTMSAAALIFIAVAAAAAALPAYRASRIDPMRALRIE